MELTCSITVVKWWRSLRPGYSDMTPEIVLIMVLKESWNGSINIHVSGESVFGSDLGQLLSKLLKCQSAMFLVYLAFLEQFTKYHVNTLLLLFLEWLQNHSQNGFGCHVNGGCLG